MLLLSKATCGEISGVTSTHAPAPSLIAVCTPTHRVRVCGTDTTPGSGEVFLSWRYNARQEDNALTEAKSPVLSIVTMGDPEDLVADLWAALKSHAQLKQLLEGGADVRVATKPDGWSLLHDAAYVKGNLRIVKLLLQHKADVNAK